MFPFIVADIGGTNARFALVTGKQGDQFSIEHIQILKGEAFPQFEDALSTYMSGLGDVKVQAACVAIAAPIDGGDQVSMTNLSWSFSQKEVEKKFGFKAFAAINDYTAVAVATSRFGDNDLHNVVKGTRDPVGNRAVIGPGTGLGVGGLVYAGEKWVAISSEGGHVNMGPSTVFEADIIKAAIARHGYVSAETCISGQGLVNLYTAIADVRGVTAEEFAPKDVTALALEDSNALCREALSTFCALLGSVCANLVLTYGAKGGVYITGGIVPRFVDFLKASEFEARFHHKGVMSDYVANVPVDLVTYSETAYLGAAAWLEQNVSY